MDLIVDVRNLNCAKPRLLVLSISVIAWLRHSFAA